MAKPKVTHHQEVNVADLRIERFQARKEKTGEGLEELARNIKECGLIQPIVVVKSDQNPDHWEVVCGQRRTLAYKKILKREKIMAGIVDGPITVVEGLVMSVTENVMRLDMSNKDLTDVCHLLYERYKKVEDVATGTGLPISWVRKYLRIAGLPEDLQEEVRKKAINLETAQSIRKEVEHSHGEYSPREGKVLLDALKPLDNPIRKKALKLRRQLPGVPIDAIVAEAEKPDLTETLKLTVLPGLAKALKAFARDEETDMASAAEMLLESHLTDRGYMASEAEEEGE